MDIDEIVDSDKKILNHTTKGVYEGMSVLVFDWQDGSPPLRGALPDTMNTAALVEWCATVRNRYNARKDSQEAEANRAAADVRRASERDAADAGESGNGGKPVPSLDADPKKTLEESVEQSLSQFRRRREAAEQERVALSAKLKAVAEYIEGLTKSIDYLTGVKEKL